MKNIICFIVCFGVCFNCNKLYEKKMQNDDNRPRSLISLLENSTKKDSGEYLFRDDFMACLKENEELHYKYLYEHFRKHLKPFEVKGK